MKFFKNDEAVSPVIGVILMVAITVILAAVIAAFVFGMSSSVESTKNVGATVTQSGNSIQVTYHGGADQNDVDVIMIDVDGQGFEEAAGTDDDTAGDAIVGQVYTYTIDGTSAKDHVIVKAQFVDGSEQVIVDNYV